MKFIIFLCGSLILAAVNCRQTDIKKCKLAVHFARKNNGKDGYFKPVVFSIHNFVHNFARRQDEILDLHLHFRGQEGLSAILSPTWDLSENIFQTGKFFRQFLNFKSSFSYISVLYYSNHQSAIFTEQIKTRKDLDRAAKCQYNANIPYVFSATKFKEVSLVVKKSGEMTWFLPQNQTFSCKHPSLADIKYIAFTGHTSNSADYKIDCTYQIVFCITKLVR